MLRAELAGTRVALAETTAERDRLARAAREAVEEERRRVARLLHDTLSQSLTALYLQSHVVAKRLENGGATEESREVADLADSIHKLVVELSRITQSLQPECSRND